MLSVSVLTVTGSWSGLPEVAWKSTQRLLFGDWKFDLSRQRLQLKSERLRRWALTERTSTKMESATFRRWLADRGCRFDQHEQRRHEGPVTVTVHREGKRAEVPLGSRQVLDPRIVRQACEELGLDWTQLPGPASRV